MKGRLLPVFTLLFFFFSGYFLKLYGGTLVQVTINGVVENTQITAPPLGGFAPMDAVVVSFMVDSDVFLNSMNFPTRGYEIIPSSFSFSGMAGSVGMENPYMGGTPYFVLRDNDPAVDGFFLATSPDAFPNGLNLEQAGVFGPFRCNQSVTYGNDPLSSLDILDAVGFYDFTGLTVYGFSIQDGPFDPMIIEFVDMTIEAVVDEPVKAKIILKEGDSVLDPTSGETGIVDQVYNPSANNLTQTAFVAQADFPSLSNTVFLWVNDGIVFTEMDDPAPWSHTSIETTRVGISDNGEYIFNPSGGSGTGDQIWNQDGLIIADDQTDVPAPAVFGPGVFVASHERPTMTPDGTAYWIMGLNDDAETGIDERALVSYSTSGDYTILLREGDLINGMPVNSFFDPDYDVSDNGDHFISVIDFDGEPTISDGGIQVNGALIAREDSPTGQGDDWDNFDHVAINDNGDYVFSGDTDNTDFSMDEFIAVNGTIVIREGDVIDGIELTSTATVQAVSINNLGDIVFTWSVSGGNEILFRGHVSDLAGTAVKILDEETEIDIDEDGTADYIIGELLAFSGPGIDLENDGVIFIEADIEPLGGGTAQMAILQIFCPVEPPPPEEECFVTCPSNIEFYLDPGECGEYLTYNIDMCPGQDVTISGPQSGDFIRADQGELTVTVEIEDSETGEPIEGCSFTVQAFEFANPVSSIACNDLVQVSLDENCQALITPDMILEGGPYACYDRYDVTVGGAVNPEQDIVTEPGTYSVTVEDFNGNFCWGEILVEDKLAPTVECEAITIRCIDLLPGKNEILAEPLVNARFNCTQNCPSEPFDDNNDAGEEPVTSSINVSYIGVVTDVNVYINLTTEDMADLEIELIGPDGTVVDLSNDECFGDPGLNVTFDSESNVQRDCDDDGNFNQGLTMRPPDGNLTTFNGLSSAGTWTLSLVDDAVNDPAILNDWALILSAGPTVVVTDNCDSYETDYYDTTIQSGDACETTIIERTWTATDEGGNVGSCVQTITVIPLEGSDINLPPEVVRVPCGTGTDPADLAAYFDEDGRGIFPYDCTSTTNPDFTANNDGYAYAYPYIIGTCGEFIPINETVCNIGATYTDQFIDDCAGEKVIRTWEVLDWCNPNDGTVIYKQVIKVIDDVPPHIDIVVNDEIEITEATDPWGCDKVLTLPHPEHLGDECVDVDYWVEIPGILNDPFNRPFSETKIFGDPHYFPDDMIDQDEEGRYVIVNAPKGTHVATYYAEDGCGNIATDQITINIVDETPPVAVALQNVVISLTSGSTDDAGIAKLYVESLNDGSHDGCSEELFMEIRREDANDCWNNTFRYVGFPYTGAPYASNPEDDTDGGAYVKFCCEDLGPDGYGLVNVVLRVWDDGDCDGTPGEIGEDNYNDTWATVRVEDKLPPTIQCPPDVTIDCDEDYLDMTLTGTATAFTTCGAKEASFSDRTDLDACGAGVVTRTWSITTPGGAASCIQKIYITALNPFVYGDITWPQDMELDCVPVNAGEPTWNTVPCSLVGSSLEQQIFEFEDGSCYKELNHWTVIDWCTYDSDASVPTGIWTETQVVKVIDTSKPELTCEDRTEWATDDCLAQDVVLTNSANDMGSDCPSDWLKWEVCLDINYDWSCDYIWTSDAGTALTFGDNIFYVSPSAQNEDVDLPSGESSDEIGELDLPIGDHRVVWTVHDGCGNVSTCTQIITVEDKKAPTPYCIQNLSTAVMDHAEYVDIWAIDFNLASADNCPGELRYTFTDTHPDQDPNYDPALRSSYQRFACEDLGDDGTEVFTLSMYVWDASDNADFCFIQLRVDDNLGVCGGGDDRAAISGLLTTEAGELVDQTDVSLNATLPEFPITQTVDGEYAFIGNPMFNSYEVTAEKDGNYLNGVSTLDMVLIQKHILGLELLNSPYKAIAADINADEKISAIDLIDLRKLILGIIEELPNNNSWRFVDASQEFADVNNPWPFTEILTIDNLTHDMMSEDFVAAKIGDVNGDVTANLTSGATEIRSNTSLNLMTTDRNFAAGDLVRVDITSEEFSDVYGYQFTMNYTGLEYAGIEAGALDMTADNLGLHRTYEGMISTSWASSESVSSTEVLFSILFTATDNGTLSESISIGSAITPAEAYRGSGLSVENVSIEFRTDNGSVSGVDYVLYQNEPNPFAASTVIGFELPRASEAVISVYDVTGKVIKVVRGDYTKGYNEVTLERNELNSAGVLYYQLESGEYITTKKMILID